MRKRLQYSAMLALISTNLFFCGCSKKSGSNPPPVINSSPPIIISLSVNAGPYTTNVTITGTGFSATAADNKVFFNGVAAAVQGANSTEILTSVPLAAGTGNVTVTVNGKTAIGPAFTYQPAEVVALLAGSGNTGSANGMGAAASFSQTVALAADASGNIYVADKGNNMVRKITPSGLVSTLAGSGSSGSSDGNGASASFSLPSGVATDSDGDVYVADKGTGLIRMITPGGQVSTLTVDGTGKQIGYGNPYYLVLDATRNVFFTDLAGNLIRMLSPHQTVTTAYTAGSSGNGIYGLALDKTGNFYTVDEFNNQIDKISLGSSATVFAGSGNMTGGANDGTGKGASFYQPWGLTVDVNGNLFVLDRGNGLIRKISPAAVVTTVCGQNPLNYFGPIATASLNGAEAITTDSSGNIYVADGKTIRKISVQ